MVAYLIHPNTSLSTHSIHSNLPQPPFLHPLSSHPPFLRLSHQLTAQQHLVCRVVQSLHTNHMQMSIIEVSICRHPHMDTSLILICIWLVCRLCTTLHTKCCGAVCRPTIPIILTHQILPHHTHFALEKEQTSEKETGSYTASDIYANYRYTWLSCTVGPNRDDMVLKAYHYYLTSQYISLCSINNFHNQL